MSKETYYSVKRDLLQCQKRSTSVSIKRLSRGLAIRIQAPLQNSSAVRHQAKKGDNSQKSLMPKKKKDTKPNKVKAKKRPDA